MHTKCCSLSLYRPTTFLLNIEYFVFFRQTFGSIFSVNISQSKYAIFLPKCALVASKLMFFPQKLHMKIDFREIGVYQVLRICEMALKLNSCWIISKFRFPPPMFNINKPKCTKTWKEAKKVFRTVCSIRLKLIQIQNRKIILKNTRFAFKLNQWAVLSSFSHQIK